jgi:hypothetical protein
LVRLGLAALKRCAAAAYQGSFSNVVDRFTLVPVFRFACDDIKFLPVLMVGPVSGFQEVSARIRSMHKSKVAPPGAAHKPPEDTWTHALISRRTNVPRTAMETRILHDLLNEMRKEIDLTE